MYDIDLETLYSMRRDQQMNNAEIAEALGVSKPTIIKLIGPQPKELNKPRGSTCSRKKKEDASEEPEACLVVETRCIDLVGACFSYRIDTKDRQLAVRGNDGLCLYADIDSLDVFIKELSAIKRKMEGERMTNEMW